jgi:hypothetical protein
LISWVSEVIQNHLTISSCHPERQRMICFSRPAGTSQRKKADPSSLRSSG